MNGTSVAQEDEEHSGGYYRCRDEISNFKIRVRVKKVIIAANSSSTGGTDTGTGTEDEEEEPVSPANTSKSGRFPNSLIKTNLDIRY